MLGSPGIQSVTLRFGNLHNCFLHVSPNLVALLRLQENQAIELSWGSHHSAFLSWTGGRQSSFHGENIVEVSRQFAEKLGIEDGEEAFLKPCQQVSSVQQVFVEPVSPDDWEILELHSASLEQSLLDQIRIIYPNGIFPVWVNHHTAISIKIESMTPACSYGRLEQLTELVISPKLRKAERASSGFPFTSDKQQRILKEEAVDTVTARAALEDVTLKKQPEETPKNIEHYQLSTSRQVTDLRSLFRYLFSSRLESNKLTPSIPSIPTVLTDSIFRVCRTSPLSSNNLNQLEISCSNTVHVLPWHYQPQRGDCCQFKLTCGRLTKLLSVREKSKQDSHRKEKKEQISNKANQTSSSDGVKETNSTVVRVICHGAEDLLSAQKCIRTQKLYSGKVWISESLRKRLNVELCSAVRICPLNSKPRVVSALRLQPLQNVKINEQDVKSSFFDWLHTQSNEELPWLTGRFNGVQLRVNEVQTEFSLSVIQPRAGDDEQSEVFFLLPSLLEKIDVQVIMEPLTTELQKSDEFSQLLSFPVLDHLGGIGNLSQETFEHISHSLMGHPFSQEFMVQSLGLRNGGLLLTGSKGSGKTSFAKALCRKAAVSLDAYVEVIECKQLQGKRVETVRKKLEDVFAEAVWRQPSIIFLDDLEHIAGSASSPELEQSPDAMMSKQIAQVLKDLVNEAVAYGSLIAFIATSQSKPSLDQSLLMVQGSHFFQCFKSIHLPNQVQRSELLCCVTKNKTNVNEGSLQMVDIQSIAKETEGFVAADFVVLVERAVHANMTSNKSTSQGVFLSTSDFQQALKGFMPTSLRNANLHTPQQIGWNHIGGLYEVKQLLIDTIQLPGKYPALFSNLPIRHRSGVLLYGAPGTGKTLLAGATAKESGMNFIKIKGPELLSKYIGASEQAVRDVFSRARAAKPSLLFFDEFDSIAPRRGHDNTGVTDRVVNQLLTELDGVEGLSGVYVLAATSRPDLIDPALLRPGRIDKSVYCPPPNQVGRLEILKALSLSVPLARDVDFELIASNTEFFTGADLKALLYNAQLEAIHSNLAAGPFHDMGSGSDSDVSLSSMIFLNHSSGSDDSSGEVEGTLENPIMCPDSTELLSEDPQQNIWRLYFGSSYESELGNKTPSELNSQCLSGPNSLTHDFTGASMRDLTSFHAPVLMTSLQDGFQELSAEQMEHLSLEVNNIKTNCRIRNTEDISHMQSAQSKPAILICQSHLLAALTNTKCSISQQAWNKYTDLYGNFGCSRDGKSKSGSFLKPSQRVTLA
ncbi:peroxisome biogenesis factor 1 isoform X1 [Polypterus senegalus]|uniref:peroxisome biogenesis factor 1 isoform X1 n=2 Tax=Polypterus senegalus TaxID=55291 RepID=UPI0019656ABE|nr:peroxisome biogenesis factor 1 isoform X1 [Polypterus senegalus]